MISMRDFLINVEDRERSVSREKGKEGKTSVRLLQKQIYLGQ